MKKTLLALALISALASCKKEGSPDLSQPAPDPLAVIDDIQTHEEWFHLSQAKHKAVLYALDTASAATKAVFFNKVEKLQKASRHGTAKTTDMTIQNLATDPTNMGPVSPNMDFDDGLQLIGSAGWQQYYYWWTGAMDPINQYRITCRENVTLIDMGATLPPQYQFQIVLCTHGGSTLSGSYHNWQYVSLGGYNDHTLYNAHLKSAGRFNGELGFYKELYYERHINFGVFLNSGGSQYY